MLFFAFNLSVLESGFRSHHQLKERNEGPIWNILSTGGVFKITPKAFFLYLPIFLNPASWAIDMFIKMRLLLLNIHTFKTNIQQTYPPSATKLYHSPQTTHARLAHKPFLRCCAQINARCMSCHTRERQGLPSPILRCKLVCEKLTLFNKTSLSVKKSQPWWSKAVPLGMAASKRYSPISHGKRVSF